MVSPIDVYLGQLRRKLETRFDSECADQLLSEIRAHLSDAASELEDDGVAREEAERLSVARFGAPEKAAFLFPLGAQFGTGDRYWGRGAFWIAMIVALGLTWYGLDPSGQRILTKNELSPILSLALVCYGYACWKAKSFSMVRQSSAVIALILIVTGMFRAFVVDPAFGHNDSGKYKGLTVERQYSPLQLTAGTSSLNLLGDLGIRTSSEPGIVLASDPAPAIAPPPASSSSVAPARVPGMAPIGIDPWGLTQQGMLPEVSQLLLAWLFLTLMTNAAVCWVGCLEHEQKGGVMLVQ